MRILRLFGVTLTPEQARAITEALPLELVHVGGGSTSPAAFMEFLKLKSLRFFAGVGVSIDDEFLAKIGSLQQLTHLDLYGCSNVTDGGLVQLVANAPPKLTTLYLTAAKIGTNGLRALARLPHLSDLNLGKTQVDDNGLAELAACPILSRISLAETKVTKAGLASLQKAQPGCQIFVSNPDLAPSLYGAEYREAIRKLAIRGIPVMVMTNTSGGWVWIKGDEPFPAGDVVFAAAVSMWSEPVGIADLQLIAALSDVEKVTLGPLPPNGLRELLSLKNLTNLNSTGSQLSDEEVALLPSFKKLNRLQLTVRSDKQLEAIAQLPHLSWLAIGRGSKISDSGLKMLESARVLSTVYLPDVSQAAAQALANTRPDVQVFWQDKLLPAIDIDRQETK